MALDLGETILQLDQVSRNLGLGYSDRRQRLLQLLDAAGRVAPEAARERTRGFYEPFLAAEVVDTLLGETEPLAPPADWTAASVDGSHIDVDRHLPVACYLVNLGGCVLTYGSRADARFFSRPRISASQDELYLRNPRRASEEEAVTGNLLGLYRTVRELAALLELVKECPPDLPVLALVDGTLVLWGLAGQGYREFVRQHLIYEEFLPVLEEFRLLSEVRPVTLAAYVSLPRGTEVANAIRRCLCTLPHSAHPELVEGPPVQDPCTKPGADPCSASNDFLDREIFGELLRPYSRSPIYRTNSSVPREYYGERQQVYFYYLNVGEEIARVEVPAWVAMNQGSVNVSAHPGLVEGPPGSDLLSLGHSLIVEQCRRGQGYPVAISEAHEQAVVTGRDRLLFRQMVEETLQQQGLPTYTSQKERSKQRPWV